MSDLRELLDRASDRVEAPPFADRALATARRRRTATRAAVATGTVLAVAASVAVGGLVLDRSADDSPPVTPPTTPSAPDSTDPAPTEDLAQDRWDPRQVDELPPAGADVAGGLPTTVDPPDTSPSLESDPIPAAVLCVQGETALHLLSADGEWRSVPSAGDLAGTDLTRDGTRLAVETETGVDVWDIPSGERTSLPNPAGFRDWDYVSWTWLDTGTLLLDDLNRGGWLVDAETGDAERVPYPEQGTLTTAVDPEGVLLESADWNDPAELTDWAGGSPRRVDMEQLGRLTMFEADTDTVVGTAYSNRPFSVVLADRTDLALRAALPVRDFEANYSNGGLTVFALLPDGTVLLRVAVFGGTMTWRLVAWDPGTGELSLVTRGEGTLLSYARGLLD